MQSLSCIKYLAFVNVDEIRKDKIGKRRHKTNKIRSTRESTVQRNPRKTFKIHNKI